MGYWEETNTNTFVDLFGEYFPKYQELKGLCFWKALKQKYNVFLPKKPADLKKAEFTIHRQWAHAIGEERIIDVKILKQLLISCCVLLLLLQGQNH